MGSVSYEASSATKPHLKNVVVCYVETAGLTAAIAVNLPSFRCQEIYWGLGSEGSTAILEYRKGRVGRNADILGNQRIAIYADSWESKTNDTAKLIWTGRVISMAEEYTPRGETVRFVAKDYREDLKRDCVWGQLCYDKDSNVTLVQPLKTIFNKSQDKRIFPNMKEVADNVTLPGGATQKIWLFDTDLRQGTKAYFSARDMIRYCYGHFIYQGNEDFISDFSKDTPESPSDLASLNMHDIDVTGKTVCEAFDEICDKAGYYWELWPLSLQMCSFSLFRKGSGVAKDIYLPPVNPGAYPDDYSSSTPGWGIQSVGDVEDKLNTNALTLNTDWGSIVNKWRAIGGAKKFEATGYFTLVPGWTQAEEDAAFGAGTRAQQISNFTSNTRKKNNASFYTYQNVGRRYILNEAGNEGKTTAAFSFDSLLTLNGTAYYTKRHRPFFGDLSTRDTTTNESKKPEIQWMYSGGSSWRSDAEVNILQDVGGLYFDGNTPIWHDPGGTAALTQGFGMVRVKAVVESDIAPVRCANATLEPTTGEAVGSATASMTIRRVMITDNEYATDSINSSEETTVSADLLSVVTSQISMTERRNETLSIRIPWISERYTLGDRITKIVGRNRYESDVENANNQDSDPSIALNAEIIGIRWNFLEQETELITSDLRMARA